MDERQMEMMQAMMQGHTAGGPQAVVLMVGGEGSGKTTAARLLNGFDWGITGFAVPLKNLVANVCGLPAAAVFGTQAEKDAPRAELGGTSGREALKIIGTDGFRAACPDVWVNLGIKSAQAMAQQGMKFVAFDDCRFQNEVDVLRQNFTHVEVWRFEVEGETPPGDDHTSNVEWRTIRPDVTFTLPRGRVDRLLSAVYKRMKLVEEMTAPMPSPIEAQLELFAEDLPDTPMKVN